jgi:hypothetical protein
MRLNSTKESHLLAGAVGAWRQYVVGVVRIIEGGERRISRALFASLDDIAQILARLVFALFLLFNLGFDFAHFEAALNIAVNIVIEYFSLCVIVRRDRFPLGGNPSISNNGLRLCALVCALGFAFDFIYTNPFE